MNGAIPPISPVRQFSVAADMAVENKDSEVNFQSLTEAFVNESANANVKTNELMDIANKGDLSSVDLIKLNMGMADMKQRVAILTHMATEATKGFKTLTQQS